MRMWLCDPKILCQQHLLGEHVEMHMLHGTLKKKKSVTGYLKNNLFQPRFLFHRHNELAMEMIKRGMKHNSVMLPHEIDIFYLSLEHQNWEMNKGLALSDLLSRCPKCQQRYASVNRN